MCFAEVSKMINAQVRILFSFLSYNFLIADVYYYAFNDIYSQRIEDISKDIEFNEDFIEENELSALAKWLVVSIAKYIAGGNKVLLARLMRNIQSIVPKDAEMLSNLRINTSVVVVFIELLCLGKYNMLSANKGLEDLGLSDMLLFVDYYAELEGVFM